MIAPDDSKALFWLKRLEGFGVFFSKPLDVDFLMLTHFPDAYKELEEGEGGPRVPHRIRNAPAHKRRIEDAVRAVLGDAGGDGSTYTDDEKSLFPWYSYLFLGKGKPSTHVLSLARLSDEEIAEGLPPVFVRLFGYVDAAVTPAPSEDE